MAPLTLDLIDFLLGARAAAALETLRDADLDDTLAVITRLRKQFSQPEAAALLDQAQLRRKAVAKFLHAERLWFVAEALEQASARAVATYRARVLAAAGAHTVADLGCGIGADTIAMAEAGLQVLAVELDPVRARLAVANVAGLGLEPRVRVLCADWTQLTFTGADAVDAAFIDPARRVDSGRGGRRRVFSLHEMVPSLAKIQTLQQSVPNLLVKVAPGVDLDEVPADASVTFIAEGIQLKEAMLGFGGLWQPPAADGTSRTPAPSSTVPRQAVVLPGPHCLSGAGEADPFAPDLREPQAVLYEPNPAVLRAGLVRNLGVRLNAGQLDPTIAYLTSESLLLSPFARAWPIERHGRFNLKQLNRWLREDGVGRVIVKKRGSAIDPDAFRKRLKTTRGGPEKTVFVTRLDGRPWMLLCGTEAPAGQ